jgi:2-polyprenyl-3-methyl-5-hydroxy-6-metoxy-1,4-benzoquinol methylase
MRTETTDHPEESKAPKEFWDSLWREGRLPDAMNPRDYSFKNAVGLKFDAFFRRVFAATGHSCGETRLLELGCARSAWLPYFSKEFGFCVTGIDYSSIGCDQAEAILSKEGVKGNVTRADLFLPQPNFLSRFDFVVSFGLVEHFEATGECIRSCGAFLKPGGTMITVIPNLNGLVGWLQKRLGREVYDIHIPLDAQALRRAHEITGLNVMTCEYFCFLNFGVLNLSRIRQSFAGLWFSRGLNAISAGTWMLDRMGVRLPANKLTSPYVVCVSTKAQ